MSGILFIIGTYPSYVGTEQVTTYLANQFVAKGYRVAIASFEQPAPELQKDCHDSIRLVALNYPVMSKDNVLKLSNTATEMNLNLIINQWVLPFQTNRLCRRVRNNNSKCKIISVYHNAPNRNARVTDVDIILKNNPNIGLLKKSMLLSKRFIMDSVIRASMHYVYKKSDQYVILSESFRDIFKAYARVANDYKLSIISNPLTIPDEVFDISKKEKIFLYVGRIDYNQKRVQRIIDVWEIVSNKLPEWRLEIVGDGPDKEKLMSRVKEKGIKRISFEGFQNPLDYYKKSSLLLLTSEYEGFGLVIIEGMRYGVVPIVYGSYEAVYDIIQNGETGLITNPPYQQSDIEKAMLKLASDDIQRQRMLHNCMQKSEHFTIDEVVKNWQELFNKLINENRTTNPTF